MKRDSMTEKAVGSEMAETPRLKLPEGKIASATRKRLSLFSTRETTP